MPRRGALTHKAQTNFQTSRYTSLLFVVTGPSYLLANILMYSFVAARLAHTVAYATKQSHEIRATLYTVGSVVVMVMAGYVLAAAAF
jgi:hypothetical protein